MMFRKSNTGAGFGQTLDVINDSEPTLENIRSQLVTENQFHSPPYAMWCNEMKEDVRYHRKQWEFVYTLQALECHNMLREGARGLGLGVGKEPLPAVMAKRGCSVLATEINIEKPHEGGWVKGSSVEDEMHDLNDRGICEPSVFRSRVSYRDVDMNQVPDDLRDFDFVWSCCSLEHLGSMRLAVEFIINSLRCLKPGGVAVHTTEYNASSNIFTIKNASTVFFRKRDIVDLARTIRLAGHDIRLNLHKGRGKLDRHIDFPPHSQDKHLKLFVTKSGMMLVATSIGLMIKKKLG